VRIAAAAVVLFAAACGRSPENERLARLERDLRGDDSDARTEAGMQLAGLDGGPAVALKVYVDHVGEDFGPGMGAAWSLGLAGPRLAPILDDLFAAIERVPFGWGRCDGKILEGLRDSGIDLSQWIRGLLAAHDVWKDSAAFQLARGRGYDIPELVTRADATLDGSGSLDPIKQAAAWYLESLAATSADARRILVRTLGDSGLNSTRAENGLAAAGDAARPEIDALLASDKTNEDVRTAALRLVAKLGHADAVESDAVVRGILSESDDVRRFAWEAAAALDPAVAADVVERSLRDPRAAVRLAALGAAGELRIASGALFPLVEKLTKSADADERRSALTALGRSGGRGVEFVVGLARAGDADAVGALDLADDLAEGDLAWILPALRSTDRRAAGVAVRLILRVRGDVSPALPELTRLASDPSSAKDDVLTALGKIGLPAVPAIVQLAAGPSDSTASYAVEQLAHLRCEAAERAVVAALSSEHEFARWQALETLTTWKALPGDSRVRVVALLADPKPDERGAAALVLAGADFDALGAQPGAVPALCIALRSRPDEHVIVAIRALAKFGPAARDAVAYLRVLKIHRSKDAEIVAEIEKAVAAIER